MADTMNELSIQVFECKQDIEHDVIVRTLLILLLFESLPSFQPMLTMYK